MIKWSEAKKNKGHTNFYECCDLTKKVYLPLTYMTIRYFEGGQGGTDPPWRQVSGSGPTEIWKFFEINA